MSKTSQNSLKKKAKEILAAAEKEGVETSYFFITTFNRYVFQLEMLEELKKQIDEDGTLVTKEYVKGRGNVYTHPAISEYNKTATAANQTATTLIKIIKSLRGKGEEEDNTDSILSVLGIK